MDTDEYTQKVAHKVTDLLHDGNHSINWLARQTGLSFSTIKHVTEGKAHLTMAVMGSIAHALDVPVTDLISD